MRTAPLRTLLVVLTLGACERPEPPSQTPPPTQAPDCARPASFATTDGERRALRSPDDSAGRTQRLEMARRFLDACGRAETVALTRELVRFRTVSAEESPADGRSFAAMADHLRAWATERGMAFRAVGANDAWEVIYGDAEAPAGTAFVMHADVVPVAEAPDGALPPGWSHPPFDARVATVDAEERLYGRGTEDDKGPIAAALVALDTLRRFGIDTRHRVLAVMGTAEENTWEGMRRYANNEPRARHTISVDADFPVVTAESGFVAWNLGLPVKLPGAAAKGRRITALRGGEFLTQVPGEASLRVRSSEPPADLIAAVDVALAAERSATSERGEPFELSKVVHRDTSEVEIRVTGEALHSSEADNGHNALWALARVAGRLELAADGRAEVLDLIATELAGDHWGERLGLSYEHPLMGKLLVTPTVLRSDAERVTLRINMRRPAGMDKAAFNARLDAALAKIQRDHHPSFSEYKERYVGDASIADIEGPLVRTLLSIYRERTGDAEAQAISIRGGTYARLFEGAVDFGPSRPGATYRGHAPDEYVPTEVLGDLTAMLFEAAVRLDDIDGGPAAAVRP